MYLERRLHDPGQHGGPARGVGAVRLQRRRPAHRAAADRRARSTRRRCFRAAHAYEQATPWRAAASEPGMSTTTAHDVRTRPSSGWRSTPSSRRARKMFCGCRRRRSARRRTRQTCPICQGMPGTLPVINRRAVGVRRADGAGLRAAGSTPSCRFARKHYYYPDMPKNYQISQYESRWPRTAALEIDLSGGARRDRHPAPAPRRRTSASCVHEGDVRTTRSRAWWTTTAPGVPLMEIVERARPALAPRRRASISRAFRAVAASTSASATATWRRARSAATPTSRCGRAARRARHQGRDQEPELVPQRAARARVRGRRGRRGALDGGERIVQETRLLDPDRGVTRSMRSKEYAHDYRYFPEPDLVPLDARRRPGSTASARRCRSCRAPARERFVTQYGLPAYDAGHPHADPARWPSTTRPCRATDLGAPTPRPFQTGSSTSLLRELDADDEATRSRRLPRSPPAHLGRTRELHRRRARSAARSRRTSSPGC